MNLPPIAHIYDDIAKAMGHHQNLVLIAPPGAGKTTFVAPKLLSEKWCNGRIILLQPRRLAAKMAASFIASQLGEDVGHNVGYITRLDKKTSPQNRLIVMTQGVFRNMLIDDPELHNISAILFDEVHERGLDNDFNLALCLQVQSVFRTDLRILAMSATMDGAGFAKILGDAPILESQGKAHRLNHHYLGRRGELSIEDDIILAVKRAMMDHPNQGGIGSDMLIFLPGVGEIERTAERLSAIYNAEQFSILPLHGSQSPQEQKTALSADKNGRRKIILATNIAETSLTIDNVNIVIDSGMTRRPRFDRQSGLMRLSTERASMASCDQRAGRAARQMEGHCYRLWEKSGNGGLLPLEPAEILESDLSALMLDCAKWGEADPSLLDWLDAPPRAGLDAARAMLYALGAIDQNGGITTHGHNIGALPLPVSLAHMILLAATSGQAEQAAILALILQEKRLNGGRDDLEYGFASAKNNKSSYAQSALQMAKNWAKIATSLVDAVSPKLPLAGLLAQAFPDMVAKKRMGDDPKYISAGGKEYRLRDGSAHIGADWLVIGQASGRASSATILSAMAIDETALISCCAGHFTSKTEVNFDQGSGKILAVEQQYFGQIKLNRRPIQKIDEADSLSIWAKLVKKNGIEIFNWDDKGRAFLARCAFAGLDQVSGENLIANMDAWLPILVENKKSLDQIKSHDLINAVRNILSWDEGQQLENLAPAYFTPPAGGEYAIDYSNGDPSVTLRVQACFGLKEHPLLGVKKIPIRLLLTSPAGRPIQTTLDLPGFWQGSWHDVAKEMRGRYPKHAWPDDPTIAIASLKTKKALNRN
ncbi:ATP-dependent helicase HrpB [Sphingorhabdus lutea]|uniref:ATP-dependent helicase HrpB n=2 Tax=Sphingorhabdus lutea TaxID=1913578 RepID=A0A1L3JEU6_9SPHN|nr:ATP-dependent helicase HrpB [Sphingorhabdus lutea]